MQLLFLCIMAVDLSLSRGLICYPQIRRAFHSKHNSHKPDDSAPTPSIEDSVLAPVSRSEPNMRTYFLREKGELVSNTNKVGTDPARFISYNLLAAVLALGANFGGITSTLMSSTSPDYFRKLKLDQLYEVGGYQRYINADDNYEFLYPSGWSQDRDVLMSKLRLVEMPSSLQESMRIKNQKYRPDVAFFPQRSSMPRAKLNNISVIKSKVMAGFGIAETLGTPQEAARFLLKTKIAPPVSGKTYTLLNAYADKEPGPRKLTRYIFEYVIRKEVDDRLVINQHSLSAIVSSGTDLYTFTAVAPDADWPQRGGACQVTLDSFAVSK